MTILQFPIPAGGIPTGNTAGRPANAVIGDVYYNGELAILEIFDGTNFVPCSAPAASPTLAVADVGTSVAYGSAQGAVTITEGTAGGPADSFLISASTGGYQATTTGTTVTITVGDNGSYTFSGQGINNFGTSLAGPSTSATLTTVPQAPTIGTATTSGATSDVTVTWTLGSDGGKNLSAITVTPFLNGTTAQTATTAATTSSTSATIVGLTQGSSYTFKVKTTNANGTSADSTATNSITVPSFFTADSLVVAGGGGGGGCNGGSSIGPGGGGAGGYRTATGLSLSKGTNYTVTVGAGGTGSVSDANATSGVNSVFSSITSTGGGRGATRFANVDTEADGLSGGSGGGGRGGNPDGALPVGLGGAGNAGSYSPVEGFAGGDGYGSAIRSGGGGGGAGEVGNTDAESAGGDGVSNSITGSAVSYAGGGGGGRGSLSSAFSGAGGDGGGGNGGGLSTSGSAGSANTGGGGGAAGSGGTNSGGNGGSGVVILRWLTADASITVGAGLTADATGTDGSYSYKRITAGSGNVSFS